MSTKKPASTPSDTLPVPESLLSRLIVSPVLFISFLFSLFLIDRQTYGGIFGKSNTNKDGYYHSHQRKLAKREMDDAFQLRGKIIVGMVAVSAMSLVMLVWMAEKFWGIWRGRVVVYG